LLLAAGEQPKRRSEVCGIKWSDINLESGTVYIQRSVVKCGGYDILIHDTKTAKSRRLIPIPEMLLDVLKALKGSTGGQEYLFARPNGQPIYPESIYDCLKILGKRIGVPTITVHMLRHTVASLLLEAGENPKVVQELLGHSSISITLDIYSHLIPGMKQQAIDKLSAMISPKVPYKCAVQTITDSPKEPERKYGDPETPIAPDYH
jgi:integrase